MDDLWTLAVVLVLTLAIILVMADGMYNDDPPPYGAIDDILEDEDEEEDEWDWE